MKKNTMNQNRQQTIDEQAKEIKRLQEQVKDAEEVIANATALINAQQDKIAKLEAQMMNTKSTDNKVAMNYSRPKSESFVDIAMAKMQNLKIMTDAIIANEEARKTSMITDKANISMFFK